VAFGILVPIVHGFVGVVLGIPLYQRFAAFVAGL
jgi:hypothetical protein